MDYYSRGVEPVADVFSLAFVIVAMCCALVLARNTERFFLSFVLLFWIIGQPVLNAYYTISPAWLPFDLQPNRILLLILIPALVYLKLQNPATNTRENPKFQKYLLAFIPLVILAMIINYDAVPAKQFVSVSLEPITFLLLYLFVRNVITKNLLAAIYKAILITAVLNAVVGFYQLVDPYFLRTADLRPAFGSVFRSFGTFSSEYTFGATLTIAFFVALFTVNNRLMKILLMAIIAAAIFTTFHRMDLLIFFVCLVFCLVKYSSRIVAILGTVTLAIGMMVLASMYLIYSSAGGSSQIVEERLKQNTMTGRLDQFRVTIEALPTYPLGLGSEENPAYQSLMIDSGHKKGVLEKGRYSYVALPVHNGFLLVGIMYGIGAMLLFTAMLGSMAQYFYRHVDSNHKSTLIPLLAVIIWILGNLTNGLVVFRSYNILLLAVLIGAYVDYRFRSWDGLRTGERAGVPKNRVHLFGKQWSSNSE